MRIVKVLFEVSATGHIVNSLRINESYRHDFFAKRRVWNNHFDTADEKSGCRPLLMSRNTSCSHASGGFSTEGLYQRSRRSRRCSCIKARTSTASAFKSPTRSASSRVYPWLARSVSRAPSGAAHKTGHVPNRSVDLPGDYCAAFVIICFFVGRLLRFEQ